MEREVFKEKIASELGYKVTKDGILLNPKGIEIGTIKKEKSSKLSYICFNRMINNKCMKIKSHRLQAYQKYGDKIYESGIVVRHLNGNSLDNSWDNIAIGTQHDNWMDIPEEIRYNISLKGNNSLRKYNTKDLYYKILKLKNDGLTHVEICKLLNINQHSSITYILKHGPHNGI